MSYAGDGGRDKGKIDTGQVFWSRAGILGKECWIWRQEEEGEDLLLAFLFL